MATNSPGATGSRERRFRNILGASWELGAWEFIAQRYSLGGHLGNQNHCRDPRRGTLALNDHMPDCIELESELGLARRSRLTQLQLELSLRASPLVLASRMDAYR
eukprot:COSAG03_NODE_397_length_8228_cov_7.191413_9_plen_105_part_00